MSQYHQTSPESPFAGKSVCSLTTPQGRITLTNGNLITTIGEQREEMEVSSEEDYRELLKTRFGIELEEGARVDRLVFSIGSGGPDSGR